MPSNPTLMLVRYTPKAGSEDALLRLVRQHWPTLTRLGLVTSSRPQLYKAMDKRTGRVSIVEIFEWADESSSETAHQTPEVMAVWEPMGPLLENMELTKLQRL